MTVRFYASTDSGAPSLVGQLAPGASILCDVLYACLVTGYGAKSGAGWTRPYVDPAPANDGKGYVFRNDSVNGTGTYYILIEDHASIATGYLYCCGTASGWGTWSDFWGRGGTNASSVIMLPRSASYDGSSRAWYCVADEKFCVLAVQTGHLTGGDAWFVYFFGDFQSFLPSDPYRSIVQGCWDQNTVSISGAENNHYGFKSWNAIDSYSFPVRGHGVRRYISGGADEDAGLWRGLMSPNPGQANGAHDVIAHEFSFMPDTNPVNSKKWANRMFVWNPESPYVVRGRIPGIWLLAHAGAAGFATGDTCQGSGAIANKEFIALRGISVAGDKIDGVLLLETSDTWYA